MKKNTLEHCIEVRDRLINDGVKNTSGSHEVPSPIIMSGTRVILH